MKKIATAGIISLLLTGSIAYGQLPDIVTHVFKVVIIPNKPSHIIFSSPRWKQEFCPVTTIGNITMIDPTMCNFTSPTWIGYDIDSNDSKVITCSTPVSLPNPIPNTLTFQADGDKCSLAVP